MPADIHHYTSVAGAVNMLNEYFAQHLFKTCRQQTAKCKERSRVTQRDESVTS